MTKIKLSVLDVGMVLQGQTTTESLQQTVRFAQLVEELGYTRYWFAEHHNTPFQISTTPSILIAHVATKTKKIRVGAGGVMLPNHSPLKVAEDYALLAALFPGRIDLGLGRAPGTDGLTALALRRTREAVYQYDFPEHLDELLHYFQRDFPEEHPFKRIHVSALEELPKIFMLGSSNGGVHFAAENGIGFAFAAHMAPDIAVPTLLQYRDSFKPSNWLSEPHGIYSIGVIIAETEEQAHYLARPAQLFWARIFSGNMGSTFPTLEEAHAHTFTEAEKAASLRMKDSLLIGTPEQVAKIIRGVADAASIEEVMVLSFYPTDASRAKGYRLLAEAMQIA